MGLLNKSEKIFKVCSYLLVIVFALVTLYPIVYAFSVSISGKLAYESGLITLLPKGLEIAQRIYERHTFLEAWLMRLGVSAKTAEADACKIEHDIHPETFAAIQKYVSATLDQYSAK